MEPRKTETPARAAWNRTECALELARQIRGAATTRLKTTPVRCSRRAPMQHAPRITAIRLHMKPFALQIDEDLLIDGHIPRPTSTFSRDKTLCPSGAAIDELP